MSKPSREKPLTQNIRADRQPLTIEDYQRTGGYQGLRKALRMTPQEVVAEVTRANLRGRGGAGFPAGQKWSFVPMGEAAPRPKYVIVNADEMEPGTMKDRLLLEADPHQVLEGAIIAAYAVGAEKAYVFLRWAYHMAARRMEQAIAEAYAAGILGRNVLGSGYGLDVILHVSAGRYMCGEENGLLDSLEGRRAIPRAKPPHPPICGLWGKPTVVNNVETLCNVGHILRNGWQWFKDLAYGDNGGTKLYGASGRVNRPGLWELPLGATLREVLEDCAGGVPAGRRLTGLLPGGGSTGFLTAEHLDLRMDYDEMEKHGSRVGTGTIIVLDDSVCPVGAVLSLQRFFARESCGWCTPCREGLPWIARLLEALEAGQGRPGDLELLAEMARLLNPGNTFCALAPGAAQPLETALVHFRQDFQRHIDEQRCPWR
ncbi:MAG: NADH-quinone oxidoreductase subunit NuoF [Phycisphaerae bacterium]|jgi:NADH-quinone oxidoreductase subunit F